MDITRRSDYACRILRAAFESGDNYVSVSEISEKEDIPYAFARSIQHDLVKGGLIKTVRGARGGLVLNCDPTKVTLLEVLEAVQGPVSVALCSVDPDYCSKQGGCAFNRVWQGADKLLNDYFASFTLADLLTLGESHPSVVEILGETGVYDKWQCAECVQPQGEQSAAKEASEQGIS
ncbi:MAG: Rrf2 family transcriptional regulator [Raoultibacter sp.]